MTLRSSKDQATVLAGRNLGWSGLTGQWGHRRACLGQPKAPIDICVSWVQEMAKQD